jgi:hypothetical protein
MSAPNQPADPHGAFVISYLTLRKAIGIIGMTLPLALLVGKVFLDAVFPLVGPAPTTLVEPSVSAYYYTRMGAVFIGGLTAISVFLLCYFGYDRDDNRATNSAGFFGLLVVLFPTLEKPDQCGDVLPSLARSLPECTEKYPFVGVIHVVSAIAFLLILARIARRHFTRTSDARPRGSEKKRQRNAIYIACARVIYLSLVAIAAFKGMEWIGWLPAGFNEKWSTVFWGEASAVMAFGVSWLVKGDAIGRLRDPEPTLQAAAQG